VPVTNAIAGIGLADSKQMVVVTDHESRVLARRTFAINALNVFFLQANLHSSASLYWTIAMSEGIGGVLGTMACGWGQCEHEVRVCLGGPVAGVPVRGEVVLAPEPVVVDAGAVRDTGVETGHETAALASRQSLSGPTATLP
jgi:hypothetical protein